MNVLINYLGKSNSGPLIAYEMARGFAKRKDVNVYAILSKSVPNRIQWDKDELFRKVVYIDTYSNLIEALINSILFLVKGKKILKSAFGGIEFDVVLNPMHHLWSSFVCEVYRSARVVSVCHDPVAHEGERHFETLLTRRLMAMSNDIIVLTRSFIPIVKEKYGLTEEHIFYMPHGILNTYGNNRGSVEWSPYHEKGWKFLFFGRIEKYKGVPVLIDAYLKLHSQLGNTELVIAGKGDLECPHVDLSTNCISIINRYISDDEICRLFEDDKVIVVLPYLSASQSGVVSIAVEFGNIVICSDTGGLREQLLDGHVGIFVRPGDSNDLYEKMHYIIRNEEEQEKQKELMKELRAMLNWEEIMEKLTNDILS